MKRLLTVFAVFLVLLVAGVPSARAVDLRDADDASRLIARFATMAGIVRHDPGLTAGSRHARLLDMMDDRLAFTEIGRFAVGRHWRYATTAERLELERLFRAVLPEVSLDRLTRYLDRNLHVDGAIWMADTAQGQNIALVRSVWHGGVVPVRVDWRIEPRDDGLKVTDVLINGLSMASTWRDYLARVGQDHGPGGIISQLRLDHQRVAGGRLIYVAMTW